MTLLNRPTRAAFAAAKKVLESAGWDECGSVSHETATGFEAYSNKPRYTSEELAHCRIVCTVCEARYKTLTEYMETCGKTHREASNG